QRVGQSWACGLDNHSAGWSPVHRPESLSSNLDGRRCVDCDAHQSLGSWTKAQTRT
ncbi:hypothetical protein FRB99_003623, partial [Tulasnella sp. 403]